ncbi:PIG-L family deacetylase [Saccharothrix xinjiangensis]|uniref:PIG-L family deacetylase n=1 Tax=Saccharothrix xinjiangensis TaxID=204798 RepID=A0ABV9Y6A4_9PSEU
MVPPNLSNPARTPAALRPPARRPAARATAPPASYVNVVAHPDDDILFMNPDLANSITADRPNTTVYLTSGEATRPVGSGRPDDPPFDECSSRGDLDREDYARCRQLGIRAAYAHMADVADEWTEELVEADVGDTSFTVEVHSLDERPDIMLVFLNLPEWGNLSDDVTVPAEDEGHTPGLHGASLYHLWFDERGARTIVPSGGGLHESDTRNWFPDRDHLVALLRHLFAWLRPTVIRTQDTDPDPRHEDPAWLHDHSDHVIGARFAIEAAFGYDGPDGRPVARVVPYRGYNIQHSQVNLDAGRRAEKATTFSVYEGWDTDSALGGIYEAWTRRMVHRHTTGTTWVGLNEDGRPQVFAAQGNRLVTWWRKASGQWSGPLAYEVPGPLAPGVSVAANADGRLQVFARRLDDHEIVTLWQVKPNGAFTGWVGLGNPNEGTDLAAQVGAPVARLTPDGLIRVFVKNGGGGLSVLAQSEPDGGFDDAWQDASGSGLQDGLAVGLDGSGGADVFGYAVQGGVGRVRHWSAPPPDEDGRLGPFAPRPDLVSFEPAGPPSAATTCDGRQDVLYRLASNDSGDRAGSVGHTRQLPDGGWASTGEVISGHGGVGPPAASDAPSEHGPIVVFATNRGGGVSTARLAVDEDFPPEWADLGGFVIGQPAAVVDHGGEVLVFGLTDDGGVVVREQADAERASPLDGWTTLRAP